MPASGKTEQMVYVLLRDHPWLVEDDKLLLLAVWKVQGLQLTDEQRVAWFSDCSTPETITRIRRKMLEDGVISQSESAKQRRQNEAKKYREKYSRQRSLF